jgi:hypothetical protein
MSLRLTLAGIIAAAGLAGCSSAPEYKGPAPITQSVFDEEEKAPEKKEAPSEPKKETPQPETYSKFTLAVTYRFSNQMAANGFESYIKLVEQTEKRELTDLERLLVAADNFDINNQIGTKDVSAALDKYAKEKGLSEIKLPQTEDVSLENTYSVEVATKTDALGEELYKLIDEKSEEDKAKVAGALRGVYDGSTPLGEKQVKKIKEYIK